MDGGKVSTHIKAYYDADKAMILGPHLTYI